MSDFGNFYGSFEAGENALKENDYITAAENFWWAEQYFEHGEFPMGGENLPKMAETARNLRYEITQHHLSTARLSKSTFVMGKQCTKQLWLHKYKYSERVVPEQLQNAFDRVHNIGEMAQHLFPDGKDANDNMFYDFKKRNLQTKTPFSILEMPFVIKQNLWIRNTKRLIDRKEKYIYEAAFVHNEVFAAVDILEITENECIAYEVKSTDSVRDVYLTDASLQYNVINAHIPIKDFYIVYLNKEYIDELNISVDELSLENCDIHKLFLKKSVLNDVLAKQTIVKQDIDKFLKVVKNKKQSPIIMPGEQCDIPYECVFKQYCSTHSK